jgi:hypothetical protein
MERGRLGRSLAFVALVVLAGCAGLTGGDPTPRDTVSPVAVPTTGEGYPPGVDEAGVSPSSLAAAHDRALAGTSFTFVRRQRVVANGTVWTTDRERRVAADGTYTGRLNRTAPEPPLQGVPPVRFAYWTNGTATAYYRESSRGPGSYAWSDGTPPVVDVTGSRTVERLFRAVEPSVVERREGVVLVGSSDRLPDALSPSLGLADPRDVSLTARVAPDGVVTRWRLTYVATADGRSVRVVRDTRVTAVGATTVERPAWIDTAHEWVGFDESSENGSATPRP